MTYCSGCGRTDMAGITHICPPIHPRDVSKDTYPWLSHERPVQTELAPNHEIDPSTQVTRTPGVDARCENGLTADTCRWPYCDCYAPDRY